MSQPWSRQQSSFADMQLWQQRLIYRQLQELQRQQRLQQLDQEARQQNSSNQFSGVAKQVAADQLPLVVNGIPIHDISTDTWKNEIMGSEQRVLSSAKMFPVGNMNWEQCRGTVPMHGFPSGLGFSQNQRQALKSTGLVQQQPDQSLYGTPVSSGRHILTQYSQFPVVSYSSSDSIAKPDGNQAEKQLVQSGKFSSFQSEKHVLPGKVCMQDGLASRQISLGKTSFGHIPVQHISNGVMLENVLQLNSLGRSRQVEEFQGRQEQTKWLKLQEIPVPKLGPSEGISALDPTEQRFLFCTDDESPCIESSERFGNIGVRGYLDGNFPEGNDYFNAFPSLQSGSWSALMQSAVAEACSSDGGLPDEWHGLTSQRKEPSSRKHPTMIFDSGKQQSAWVKNFQSASSSTSKSLPTSDDADASAKNDTAATFCQSYVRSAQDRGQRLDAETSSRYQLDLSQMHQRGLESIVQSQMHSGSMSGGTRVQTYEQPLSNGPVESKLHHQGLCGPWSNQQKVPLCNGSQLHDKVNTWNASELASPTQDAMLKADDPENIVQNSWLNFPKEEVHMRRYQEINVQKNDGAQMSLPFSHPTGGFCSGSQTSGIGSPQVQTGKNCMDNSIGTSLDNLNKETNEKSASGHQANHGKLMPADSSMESRGNEDAVKHNLQVKNDQPMWRSSVNIFEGASNVAYDKEMDNSSQKEVSDGDRISNNSHSGQLNDSGGIRRKNCLLAQSDSSQLASGGKMPSCQIGQKSSDSRRLHFLPMGNLDVDVEHPTSKHNFYSQGQFQMVMSGAKSHTEPELIGKSQFGGHSASISQRDMDTQLFDSQRDVNALEEVRCGGRISIYDSDIPSLFKGSTTNLEPNKSDQGHQTSQNMFELSRKVDQSRHSSNVSHSGFPNHNMVAEKPDEATCDMPSYLQHNQCSALQEVGLGLPLKHQSILHHALPSQAVQHYNSRHFELEAGGKRQTCETSSVSIHPLPPLQVSERENMDTRSSLSGLPNKETSLPNVMLSSAMSTSMLFYARNQLQQQLHQQLQKQQLLHRQVSVASGCDQYIGTHCGSELDQDTHSKSLLHTRESNDLHGGTMHVEDIGVAEQFGEQLLLGVGQTPSFKVASLDGLSPVMSYALPNNPGQSQMMGAASSPISTSQLSHLPVLEKQSVLRPSATSLISQQASFSPMLQNVWTNLSQQHLSGNLPANVRPSLFQSLSVGTMDMNYPAMQRLDIQGRENTSMFATCSIISEQATCEEKDASEFSSLLQNPSQAVDMAPHTSSTPLVQEYISERVSGGNSCASIVPMVQLHQQEIGGLNLGERSSLDKQTSHSCLLNIAYSSHNLAALGHNFKSPDVQNQNYSLLQQLHTMKPVEADSSKLYDKRLKGDSVAYPQPVANEMPQSSNMMSNNPLDNRSCPKTGHQSSFPSDTKMLCFSLEANGNQNMARASQVIGNDFCSKDFTDLGLISPHHFSSFGKISMPPSVGVIQPKQMDHRVAPSWFEQYEKFKNGQTLAKAAVQHCFLSRASESTCFPSSVTQGSDSSQTISFWHTSSTATANEQSSSVHYTPADDIGRSVIPRPNKRKTSSSRLIPWHKEITRGSDKLWNISMAELEWAQATKRLCSKVENEDKTSVDGLSIPRAQRRLVLTTQLMQQLVPAFPLRIFASDVTLEFESVMYHVARLALGDACGRISCSRSNLHFPYVGRNMISEKLKTTRGAGEHFFSEVTEGFIGRMSKLENELSRSEMRDSLLYIRAECQDLERFSIMNRFAKFHGRSQADVVEISSTSEAAPWKMFLQRYVTALPMRGNLPEGMICLSL